MIGPGEDERASNIKTVYTRARHVKFFEYFRFYILQKIWKQILHFTRACKKVGFYILQITRVCKNQFLQITFYRILQDFTRFNKLHFTGFYKILQDFTRFYKLNSTIFYILQEKRNLDLLE